LPCQPFINNYQAQIDVLQERLKVMTVNLPLPFCNAMLPALVQPREALASLR